MGKRGPKPTPTKILQLRGSWRGNTRKNEIQPLAKAPRMPEWLTPNAKTEWRRVTKLLIDLGIITELDRAVIAAYCQAWADYIEACSYCKQGILVHTVKGNVMQNPAVGVKNTTLKILLKAAAELGMTPSGRSSINIPKVPPKTDKAKKYFDKIG